MKLEMWGRGRDLWYRSNSDLGDCATGGDEMSVTEKEIEAGKMGCGDGEAPGEHQHNWEEEQLKRFLLTEAKKKKRGRQS